MEWTKAETLKFIELWQGFPCLWNVKSAHYKNRQKRRDAIIYLAGEMGIETPSIEKKILSLKTQFNRELNKIKNKSGAGSEEAYQPNWYAYEYLQFIKDINVPRPSTDSWTISLENEDVIIDEIITQEESTLHQEQPLSQSQSNEGLPHTVVEQRQCSKRKRDEQIDTLNILKDTSNAIINRQKKDGFSTFGELVASELREVNSKQELINLKKGMLNLIYDSKLKILRQEVDKENEPGPSRLN